MESDEQLFESLSKKKLALIKSRQKFRKEIDDIPTSQEHIHEILRHMDLLIKNISIALRQMELDIDVDAEKTLVDEEVRKLIKKVNSLLEE